MLGTDLAVLPHQPRLRAAHRRLVEQQAPVAGEAEPARVRKPLTVEQERVWLHPQPSTRFEQRGNLAKREQAGDIRKGRAAVPLGQLDDLERREPDEHDGRVHPMRAARVRDVGPRHQTHRLSQRLDTHLRPARFLDCDRFSTGDTPRVEGLCFHDWIGSIA